MFSRLKPSDPFPSIQVLLFGILPIAAAPAAEPPRDLLDRPNVLLVMADDVGWEAFSCYGPDLFADFLGDFMEENRDRPFLAYFPMTLVHDPFVTTPETIGDAPRDQSANKQPRGKDAGPKKKANFVAMVEYMDDIVGRLVARIDELGLSQNTLVVFTSDNGTHPSIVSRWQGRDIRGDKAGLTDAGTRVPLVVSWPGVVREGAVLDDLVDFTDIYPTLADASGRKTSDDEILDGRSFLPQLRGEPGQPREWILNYYQPYWNKEAGLWVRDREYKLYADGRFYHVPEDLEEKNPIPVGAAGEEGEAARAKLQAVLDRCPPLPEGKLGKETAERPAYPDWPRLLSGRK